MAETTMQTLADGFTCYVQNRQEARMIYAEIFGGRDYLPPGVRLPDDAFVVDAGGNIGLFSLFVKQECPGAEVLAFEPVPELAELFRRNVTLHGAAGVTLREFALGGRAEEGVPFTYYPRLPGNSTRYPEQKDAQRRVMTTMSDAEWTDKAFTGREFTVAVRPLSACLPDRRLRPRIDLVKIDVEGAELDVLDGIDDADWPRIKRFAMEAQDHDDRLRRIVERLQGKGFEASVALHPLIPPALRTYLVHAERPARP